MDRTGRAVRILAALLASAILVGVGLYLLRQGLDRADKLSSVLGLFLNIAAVALAVVGLRRGKAPRDTADKVATGLKQVTFIGRVNAGRDVVVGDISYGPHSDDDDRS